MTSNLREGLCPGRNGFLPRFDWLSLGLPSRERPRDDAIASPRALMSKVPLLLLSCLAVSVTEG